MNIRILITVTVSVLALLVASCTSMKSAHYVGKKQPIFENSDDVTIWRRGSKVFHVKPIDDFTAVVSTLEWDNSLKRFKQTDSTVVVSELDEQMFLNVRSEGVYTIVRMTPSLDGAIVLFEANDSKLKADVKSGLIRVKENVDEVKIDPVFTLEMSKRELDRYVSENMAELFDMGSVAVIIPIFVPDEEGDDPNEKNRKSTSKVSIANDPQ